ncbi:MAG: transposase [Bryobacteraceae bacterium]|nr:transposase [Bryobacteraceae bacterium]
MAKIFMRFFPPKTRYRIAMAFYRRHLPHLFDQGRPIFVTFRLAGSLPPGKWTSDHQAQNFSELETALEERPQGPLWLQDPGIAEIVINAIGFNATKLKHFDTHAFVVMANHVHLLMTPLVPLPKLMHSLKSITAKQANIALNRTGAAFWQAESFDHMVRNDKEFARIVEYIHYNPVKAGLVAKPEDFPWSSASVGRAPWPASLLGEAGQGARPTTTSN